MKTNQPNRKPTIWSLSPSPCSPRGQQVGRRDAAPSASPSIAAGQRGARLRGSLRQRAQHPCPAGSSAEAAQGADAEPGGHPQGRGRRTGEPKIALAIQRAPAGLSAPFPEPSNILPR